MIDATRELLEQTRVCITTNHALLDASRYRIAAARRRLNPRFAFTGGSDTETLRTIIRARLASGALFRVDGTRAWASYGTGASCVVSREPVTRAQVEYEVASAGAGPTASAHLRCYKLWNEESKAPPRARRRVDGVQGVQPDPRSS